jgi:murein DD-endopeptidase MepM/ murein hydrolase activator NlpD
MTRVGELLTNVDPSTSRVASRSSSVSWLADVALTVAAQRCNFGVSERYASMSAGGGLSTLTGGASRAVGSELLLRCAAAGEIAASGWTVPIQGSITSGFRTSSRPGHNGVDIAVGKGTPVRAAAAGVVLVATCNAHVGSQSYSCDQDGSVSVKGCGWYVDILHAANVITRYCHLMSRPYVQTGQSIGAGQIIGLSGSSGHSSGPHLHFEVHLHADDSSYGAIGLVHNWSGNRGTGGRCRRRSRGRPRPSVAGRRSSSEFAWVRGDLRADDDRSGSRGFVPVWRQDYTAKSNGEVFAPLVPVSRVWVEQAASEPSSFVLAAATIDIPPTRHAVPASTAVSLCGRRMIQQVPDGFVRDLRAVTDRYHSGSGAAVVRVCGELEWFAWAITGQTPAIVELAAATVWAE